ncbi:MAG: thioredoxin [Candidatus Nealsonbacteria bacterium]|nr:thioredoxin [Candidatus Nealsonbacteria bacterium]
MPVTLTDKNFEKEIQRTDKLALVDFYATWCEPCSLIAPVLEKLEKEFEEKIVLLKANVDEIPFNAQKFQVDRIPMVTLFKGGKPISAFTGFRPESVIKEWLEKMIQDNMSFESSEDKQKKIEEMIKEYSEYAQNNGFQLNPDRKNVERVINGLLENEKKNGKKYCPCRRLSKNKEEDSKKICPCAYHKDEIAKDGRCFCGLFIK